MLIANKNNAINNMINTNKIITSKYFEYKTKLIGSIPDDNNTSDAEAVVLLRYLSNFWRSLDLPLINCKMELDLPWSKNCIISEISIIPRISPNPNANPHVQKIAAIQTTSATFQINNAKLYVPVVTLSIKDNINFLESKKQEFKKTIFQKKYRSEITTQPKIQYFRLSG